jgi:hypothetical protein
VVYAGRSSLRLAPLPCLLIALKNAMRRKGKEEKFLDDERICAE